MNIRWVALAGALVLMPTAQAQAPVGGEAQAQRLVEQKIRLVESLINSPAAKSAAYGREAETPALLITGNSLLEKAKAAAAASRLDEANAALDDALRLASKASNRLPGRGEALSQSAQQASFRNLDEQVATYLAALDDLGRKNREAREIAVRLGAMKKEAGKMQEAERLGDANRKLGDAYRLAVESLSRLRAGETVTLSLKFDTPAEEYAYELKRFHSSEILIGMAVDEGRAPGERRSVIDNAVRSAHELKDTAVKLAENGGYRDAVSILEQATTQLNRALQTMGIPVF